MCDNISLTNNGLCAYVGLCFGKFSVLISNEGYIIQDIVDNIHINKNFLGSSKIFECKSLRTIALTHPRTDT